MAEQNSSNPPGRSLSMSSKMAVSSKPAGGKGAKPQGQALVGKLGKGMEAMPGSKGKGQAVVTVKSNPIRGEKCAQKGNSAMGDDGVKNGFV